MYQPTMSYSWALPIPSRSICLIWDLINQGKKIDLGTYILDKPNVLQIWINCHYVIQNVSNFNSIHYKLFTNDSQVCTRWRMSKQKKRGFILVPAITEKKLCSFFYKTLQITLWNFHPSCVLVFYNRPSYPQYLLRYLDYKA